MKHQSNQTKTQSKVLSYIIIIHITYVHRKIIHLHEICTELN